MKILVEGQLLEYKDEGKGRVVVLLHGWGASLATFDELSKNLATRFRVIRFDFPGFGASPKPADSWGVGEYATLLGALIKKLKIDDVYAVIGHSFGGRVIIKGKDMGVLKPEKVVLIGSAGVKPERTARKALFGVVAKSGKALTAIPGLKALRPALRKRLYGVAGSTDYLAAQNMRQIFLNTINEDLLPLVHSITQPALLIWGEDDHETPVGDAQKIVKELSDARLMVIPGAGHFVYLDDPAAVNKELAVFL